MTLLNKANAEARRRRETREKTCVNLRFSVDSQMHTDKKIKL